MKKYNIINNSLGWLCFVIAAITYLVTMEPTASFWDCPEFISQGAKLDIGHPPGNPIFMLAARFFVTIFGGNILNAAVAINTMSALLSAATILLLFWTITHLVRKIMVSDDATDISWRRIAVIMGAGLCGALVYTWSDTFWFSAVESEVYAFSSFCTALVFWLILKWENRADQPHSDRYLVLIAYIIGVSIAVHLLNLLCIPAIVLVFYYRKHKNANAVGSLIALGVSVVLVALILYGLVPGFIKVAQFFELFAVNTLGMSYNSGVLIYTFLLLAVFAGAIFFVNKGTNALSIKIFSYLALVLSGLTFITDSKLVWVLLFIGFAVYLFGFCRPLPLRVFNVAILSLFFIFVGYSSYALLLIRASANPPMNQNAPDNVFTLSSYLNREQYGQRPLFYGPVFMETYRSTTDGDNNEYILVDTNTGLPIVQDMDMSSIIYYDSDGMVRKKESKSYAKAAKKSPDEPDKYFEVSGLVDYEYSPDACMLFPRMYSYDKNHIAGYKGWSLYENSDIANLEKSTSQEQRNAWAEVGGAPAYQLRPYLRNLKTVSQVEGRHEYDTQAWKPTFFDNLKYFFNYQMNHMYWRYFMWNFAGRQNDIQGNGEPNLGNWISGIPFIDNARLGDQSLVPEYYTTGNKGHNVFYMLPLLLGIFGIIWQSLCLHRRNPHRGIEQFWVVFFLFFMTGIAIVIYLNQTPGQPRERDYAFAGSFYAFSIWVGMGVPAIQRFINNIFAKKPSAKDAKNGQGEASLAKPSDKVKYASAAVACAIGIFVPLQMVSQTWDDHDRSHRYAARDFGFNYLNSLDENAVIFTNGDNDTFPLWYAQEVEGVRQDVRVVNLSYLSTDWYANQLKQPFYSAAPVKFLAEPTDYAYDNLAATFLAKDASREPIDAIEGLKQLYASGKAELTTPVMYVRADSAATLKAMAMPAELQDSLMRNYFSTVDMNALDSRVSYLNKLLSFDIVANSIADNFERPVYFASTVPGNYYLNLQPYMYSTGIARQITPFKNSPVSPVADKAYENIMSKFRWGGLDDPKHNKDLYLDETVRRMVTTHRGSIIDAAHDQLLLGDIPASEFAVNWAKENGQPVPTNRYDMARNLLLLVEEKLPEEAMQHESLTDLNLISEYLQLYAATGNESDLENAQRLLNGSQKRIGELARYALSLSPHRYNMLGVTDLYSLQLEPLLINFQMYIDVLSKAKDNPAISEADLAMINSSLSIDKGLYPSIYAYAYEHNADQLAEAAQVRRNLGMDDVAQEMEVAVAILNALEAMGVNPEEAVKKVIAPYGLTKNDLIRFNS